MIDNGRSPHWRPRLVVIDLDGTVVPGPGFTGGPPSPAVRTALAKVRAAGVPVVVATARTILLCFDTLSQLGLDNGWLVCGNGGITYHLDSRTFRHRVTFDAAPVAKALAAALPGAEFAVEEGAHGFRATPGFCAGLPLTPVAAQPLPELLAAPVTRMACRAHAHPRAAISAAAIAATTGHDVVWASEVEGWLDIRPAGLSKAAAVVAVAEQLAVAPADALAIGDGANDVPVFAWAGCSVAMGDAPQAVRDAATYVTGDVAADGAATALARWFP
ncbi:MAG: HAD family hydrolase [Micromonosporaceae bacterium]